VLAQIEQCLHDALQVLKVEGVIPQDISPLIRVQRTPDAVFGDLTTNLALLLSEACDVAARDIAQRLVDAILRQPSALEVDIAGPAVSSVPEKAFRRVSLLQQARHLCMLDKGEWWHWGRA